MTGSCDQLDAYVDGTLADRRAYEKHLLTCVACQDALEDVMQILAAGAELSRREDRPRIPPRRRPRRRIAVWAAATTVPVAAAAAMLTMQPPSAPAPTVDDQLAAVLAPHRAQPFRLPYAPLDRYRTYDVARGAASGEQIPLALTAAVEAQRPTASLAAVLIASADLARADAALARVSNDHGDALELDRGALAIARRQPSDALDHFDRVLAHSASNAVALWNRGVALDDLQLSLAAAESFDTVARLGEPGWSGDARGRASELRKLPDEHKLRWNSDRAACVSMASAAPDRSAIRNNSACRPQLYNALIEATSRDAVLALAPVAQELDAYAGSTAATDLVRKVAAAPPGLRRRAAALYAQLSHKPELAARDKRRVLDELRATGQDDILIAALWLTQLPDLQAEHIARLRATRDPYFAELADERAADELAARGDPLGAEVVLRRAVNQCLSRDIELRCSYLQIALANIYMTMNRLSDVRAVAQTAIERSRRLGLYWDERELMNFLADVAEREQQHGLMRGYLRETTLSHGDDCNQVQYAQESLAVASIDAVQLAQARSELAAAPSCGDAPPTLERARVVAELARFDGTAEEATALRAGLARARAVEDVTVGERAALDAFEGRLVSARDPDAARPLLRRAIATAAEAPASDTDAASARRDAYGELLVLAARSGDRAATLALFAEASGASLQPAPACAVGVMVDAERLLVVARDTAGSFRQQLDEKAITAPPADGRGLVPDAIARSLAACPRVDVVALPPVLGLPNLLPAELAWSYHSQSAARAAPPTGPPTVVTIADATPPRELDLPRLARRDRPPIAGARHVDLVGDSATPARAIDAFDRADVLEIHAHGFIDLGVSDASMIALSPQGDGRFALSAREIAGLHLARAPLVTLAACHAAYTAPYRHESWGLPRAFLLAGARAVLASPGIVSDGDAVELFRAVEARALHGEDPAAALRDERRKRLARDPHDWSGQVLLFD